MQDIARIDTNKYNPILMVIKGVFWAVSVSLLGVLLFAVVIKYTSITESAIQPINQVIKIISILLGCLVVGKKISSKGWLWGLIIGVAYTIVAFIVFSILDGSFNITGNLFNDILFGGILGLIAGVICISLRK